MDQQETLVRLLVGVMGERAYRPLIEGIADDLIANGVVVLPCKPGDRVRHLGWDHEFVVNTVELGHKAGTLFRCGNPGTEDYTAFYEDEIGERVIVIGNGKEEERCQSYLVVAGFSDGRGARAHHTMEVVASSKYEAIAKAIEADKEDGEFSKDYQYYAFLQPCALDKCLPGSLRRNVHKTS